MTSRSTFDLVTSLFDLSKSRESLLKKLELNRSIPHGGDAPEVDLGDGVHVMVGGAELEVAHHGHQDH